MFLGWGELTVSVRCREQVHFETCPTSSILTGAQPLEYFYHAVAKFADDQANFRWGWYCRLSVLAKNLTCFLRP